MVLSLQYGYLCLHVHICGARDQARGILLEHDDVIRKDQYWKRATLLHYCKGSIPESFWLNVRRESSMGQWMEQELHPWFIDLKLHSNEYFSFLFLQRFYKHAHAYFVAAGLSNNSSLVPILISRHRICLRLLQYDSNACLASRDSVMADS